MSNKKVKRIVKESKHIKKTKGIPEDHFQRRKTVFTSLLILFFILSLGCALRLYKLDSESLWSDEIHVVIHTHYVQIRNISDLVMRASIQQQPPFYFILQHYFQKYIGDSDFWVRFPAAMYGIIGIISVYLLARLLFGQKEALISAFLLSISVFHIQHSQEVRPYTLVTLLFPLCIYFFWQVLLKDGMRYWFFLTIFTLLTLYTHSFVLLLVFVQVLFCVFIFFLNKIYPNEKFAIVTHKKMLKIVLYSVFVTFLFIPEIQVLTKYGSGYLTTYKQPFFLRLVSAVSHFSADWFKRIYLTFGGTLPFFYQSCNLPSELRNVCWSYGSFSSFIYLFFAFLGLYFLARKNCLKFVLFCFLLLILPLMELTMFRFLGIERFEVRYIIFLLPIYLALVSTGLLFFSERFTYFLSSILKCQVKPLYFLISVLVVLGYLHFSALKDYYLIQHREDWRGATDFIVKEIPPGDKVVFQPDWTIQNYFFYAYRRYGGKIKNIQPVNPKKSWWVISDPDWNASVLNKNIALVKSFSGPVSIWSEE